MTDEPKKPKHHGLDEPDDGPRRPQPAGLGEPETNESRDQEKRIAGRLRTRPTYNSGAGDEKGDVRWDELGIRIEAKRTKYAGTYIKPEWLIKITEEAMAARCDPAIFLEFGGQSPPTPQNWVMLPEDVFMKLIDQ